jgi:hypothetical protein
MSQRNIVMGLLAVSASVAAAAQPYSGEIREALSLPVVATFTSAKPVYDLEVCVADVLSAEGAPIVLRDGPNDVLMLAYNGFNTAYYASVRLHPTDRGTTLDLRARKAFQNKMVGRLPECL